MDKILQVSFLVGIRLLWKGQIVSQFAAKKVIGLFCCLIENLDSDISREKLMNIFWGEFPESQARYNLRYALWNIRKIFKSSERDNDPLVSTRETCKMNPVFQIKKVPTTSWHLWKVHRAKTSLMS